MRSALLCLLISLALPCVAQEDEWPKFLDLSTKAKSLWDKGEYTRAESTYRSALLCHVDSSAAVMERIHINIASLCTATGRYNDALAELSHCSKTDMLAKIHQSNAYLRLGDYDKSLAYLDTVISSDSSNSNMVATAHQNKGYVYWQLHQYEKAAAEMAIALPHLQGIVKQASLGNYALILARLGEYTKALQTINQAIVQTNNKSEDYTILLRKKAEILLMSGSFGKLRNREEAQAIFNEFYLREKAFAVKNFATMTEQNRLDFWKTLKPNISKVFALENDCPDFLLDVALFRREVALLGNAEKSEMTKRLNITGEQIRKALKPHEVAIDFVRYQKNDTAWYGAIIVPSMPMKQKVQFVPLWKEEDLHGLYVNNDSTLRLDSALCSSNMGDKDVLYTDSLLKEFVWKKLDCILDKYDYEDVYFAPDGLLHILAIEYLRDDNGVSMHRLTSLTKLLDRNKHNITRKSKMLAAGGMDYDAKSESAPNSNHANHDAMEYLQSQFGHIDNPFTYLDGALVEIDSISTVSPFTTEKTAIETESQLKTSIRNRKYNILHLSTHGYALDVKVPKVPEFMADSVTEDRSLLASGIALTGANVAYKDANLDDGIISAREFCEMDLSNIDLFVLSACQTGLGRFNDEGPAGLVRGLKKAGAGALIVSLWSVSDEATMLFMKHLYKALSEQSKLDIHAAFNTARMNFSKETKKSQRFDAGRMTSVTYDESFNQPRYCNSFILIDATK